MSRRVGAWHEVKLHARGYSHYVPHAGASFTDRMKDMGAQKRGITPLFDPHTYGLTPLANQQSATVAIMTLGEWGTATAVAIPDLVQAATLTSSYYTFHGGTWSDIEGAFGQHWMFQTDGVPDTRGFWTNWTFPPDPTFLVAFWRADVNHTWVGPGTGEAAYTVIAFGGSDVASGTAQFRIYIPYEQSGPEVHAYNDAQARYEPLPLVEGSQPIGPIGAVQGGEWCYLWVTCARDALWVSTDGFRGRTAGYHIPELYLQADGTEVSPSVGRRVLSGAVGITHSGGIWGANVYPIWMPRSTATPALAPTFQSDPHEFGYAVASNPHTVSAVAITDDVLSDPGESTVLGSVSLAVVTTGPYSRAWKATLEPVAWTNGGVTTYTSPLLHAVQMSQKPNVVTAPGPAPTSTVATEVRSIELTYPGVGKPAVGKLTFLNTGGTYSSLLDYQRVAIKLGTKVSGTTSAATSGVVFTGYIRTPGGQWRGGTAQQAEAYIFDAMTRIDDLKSVGDEPDPALMSASNAVGWYLARGMVPSGSMSGNAGTGLMTVGYVAEDNVLAPRLGQPYREVVNRILAKGQAGSTTTDKGGFMFLQYTSAPVWERWAIRSGPFTATGVSWALTEKSPPDHGSSVFHIYDLTVDKRAPADDHEWANLVTVRGKTKAGWPLVAHAIDTDGSSYDPAGADFAGGWHHNLPIEDETLGTQEECFAAALAKLSQINTLPKFITVETDFLSGCAYGQVFSLTGPATGKVARAGVARDKYRVEEYAHRVVIREIPKTTLMGRWIGSMAV